MLTLLLWPDLADTARLQRRGLASGRSRWRPGIGSSRGHRTRPHGRRTARCSAPVDERPAPI